MHAMDGNERDARCVTEGGAPQQRRRSMQHAHRHMPVTQPMIRKLQQRRTGAALRGGGDSLPRPRCSRHTLTRARISRAQGRHERSHGGAHTRQYMIARDAASAPAPAVPPGGRVSSAHPALPRAETQVQRRTRARDAAHASDNVASMCARRTGGSARNGSQRGHKPRSLTDSLTCRKARDCRKGRQHGRRV
jgi:hypothetical protein